jgi:3-hydroxyisobutyrate dehydrogenase-like beta-hydroxyacid dehydrogenase
MPDRTGFSEADYVFAMVQPRVTEIAARDAAPHLRPGSIYVDFSSASPQRKQAAAALVRAQGADYVDAGIIGSVPSSGHRVPVVASGPAAAAFRDRFAPFGMDIALVGEEIGAAAGIKLIRSVLAKGLEALYVEALTAAQRAGVTEDVLGSFCAFLDARPARATAALLLQSHVVHAARRADEVRMSRDMLVEAGVAPLMTDAIIAVMDESAAAGLADKAGRRQPASLERALDLIERAWPDTRAAAATERNEVSS